MSESTRESLKRRVLTAPFMDFSINEEVEKLRKEPAWLKGDRNAVTLQKDSNLRVVLTSLRKGTTLHEHTVVGPITLFVLSGKLNFIVGLEKVCVEANEFIVLEKAIPHNVEALEDVAFILTLIQPQQHIEINQKELKD